MKLLREMEKRGIDATQKELKALNVLLSSWQPVMMQLRKN
jgi:hypothetical protein